MLHCLFLLASRSPAAVLSLRPSTRLTDSRQVYAHAVWLFVCESVLGLPCLLFSFHAPRLIWMYLFDYILSFRSVPFWSMLAARLQRWQCWLVSQSTTRVASEIFQQRLGGLSWDYRNVCPYLNKPKIMLLPEAAPNRTCNMQRREFWSQRKVWVLTVFQLSDSTEFIFLLKVPMVVHLVIILSIHVFYASAMATWRHHSFWLVPFSRYTVSHERLEGIFSDLATSFTWTQDTFVVRAYLHTNLLDHFCKFSNWTLSSL